VDETQQARQDADHLRALSICFYVFAVLSGLVGCFPIIHLVVGSAMLVGGLAGQKDVAPAAVVGGIFVGVAVVFITVAWTIAGLYAFAGRSLAQRRRYVFCLIMAGLMAVTCVPLGTVLGVFTFIVLQRPTVKPLFGVS
jgi:hypothetical protein